MGRQRAAFSFFTLNLAGSSRIPSFLYFFLFLSACTPVDYKFSNIHLNSLHTPLPFPFLHQKIREKGAVFVVPYCVKISKNGQPYVAIFLGRERIDSEKKDKRGMYSEFGGRTSEKPTSLAENLDREFREETMDQFYLNWNRVPPNTFLFFSISDLTKWPYWGITYPFTGKQVQKSLGLNLLRKNEKFTSKLPLAKLEKDAFYWFKLEDLMVAAKKGKEKTQLKPLFVEEPGLVEVTLRPHFIKYFLNHPALPEFIEKIKSSASIIQAN